MNKYRNKQKHSYQINSVAWSRTRQALCTVGFEKFSLFHFGNRLFDRDYSKLFRLMLILDRDVKFIYWRIFIVVLFYFK